MTFDDGQMKQLAEFIPVTVATILQQQQATATVNTIPLRGIDTAVTMPQQTGGPSMKVEFRTVYGEVIVSE